MKVAEHKSITPQQTSIKFPCLMRSTKSGAIILATGFAPVSNGTVGYTGTLLVKGTSPDDVVGDDVVGEYYGDWHEFFVPMPEGETLTLSNKAE